MNRKTGIIILAAGSSSRLGRPKQLVETEGKSLIRRIIETTLSLKEKVIVVTGAFSEAVESEIKDLNVLILHNELWQDGMTSSMHKGLTYLSVNNYDAAMILVCDQLDITSALLQNLVDAWVNEGLPVGVLRLWGPVRERLPCLTKSLFDELFNLSGDNGAKTVILNHIDEARIIAFPGGLIDIDTTDDLKNLKD